MTLRHDRHFVGLMDGGIPAKNCGRFIKVFLYCISPHQTHCTLLEISSSVLRCSCKYKIFLPPLDIFKLQIAFSIIALVRSSLIVVTRMIAGYVVMYGDKVQDTTGGSTAFVVVGGSIGMKDEHFIFD
jgi:hypothetical protein